MQRLYDFAFRTTGLMTLLKYLIETINKRLSLRTVLIVPFVLQIVGTVGLVGYLSFKNGQKSVNELVNQLMDEVSDRVDLHLDNYLTIPQKINQTTVDAIDLGLLNLKDFEKIGHFFWKQVRLHDVSYINYGLTTGEYAGAGYFDQDPNKITVSETSARTQGRNYIYATDSQGNRTKLKWVYANYDHRQEDWYIRVAQIGKPCWSLVYLWDEVPDYISINAAYPIYDKNRQFIGAIGVDLILLKLSEFLREIDLSPSARIFIVERDGLIIASSGDDRPFKLVAGRAKRLSATDSSDPLIQSTAKYLQQKFGNLKAFKTSQTLLFEAEGDRNFVRVLPWRDGYGLEWLVVTVVPESHFMTQINANNRTTIALCLVALGVSTGLGILTARWITKPILRINSAAKAIAAGELDQSIALERTDELGTLAQSFNSMATQIQASFTALEGTNQELEQKVQERTVSLAAAEAELRGIFEAMTELIFVVDRQGRYLKVMATQPGLLYAPSNLLLGRTISEVIPSDTAARFLGYIETVLEKQQPLKVEYSLNIDDHEFWFAANASPISADAVVWVARDISDRKQAEKDLQEKNEELARAIEQLQATQVELIQSEKMAALGQLIASIAHELNTPLGAIGASISNISRFLEQSFQQLPQLFRQLSPEQLDDFFTLLEIARQAEEPLSFRQERQLKRTLQQTLQEQGIERAETLAQTLSQMGIDLPREKETELAPLMRLLQAPNNTFILETAYNLSALQNNSQNTKLAVERASKIVLALKNYVRQDLTGRMVKASVTEGIDTVLTIYRDRLKRGIEVTKNYQNVPSIPCYPEELTQVWSNLISNAIGAMNEQGYLEIAVFERGDHVVVEITDSGCGIPGEIQDKIFTPFFTTKPVGEGSGLGLDIVRKIVEKHQGKIEFTSQPGNTKFSVSLPIG